MGSIINLFLSKFRKSEILNLIKELRVYCGECGKEISDNDKAGEYCASTHSAYHIGKCADKARAREIAEYDYFVKNSMAFTTLNYAMPSFQKKTIEELIDLKLEGWIVDRKK